MKALIWFAVAGGLWALARYVHQPRPYRYNGLNDLGPWPVYGLAIFAFIAGTAHC